VSKAVAEVGAGKAIVARIFVCPTEDADRARFVGRVGIAAYLNVAVYAAFHEWLGRGPLLEPMWAAWRAGDRKAALAAIPDEVVDALVVHGTPQECRAHVQRYVDNGVTVPVLAVLPGGDDLSKAVENLAPGPV
jgi:alkanesulfonate monooxygenase SsuD/methylene tetrahydromethanopterin reductase-like flavin-dependent oxidoreductase (luciferase family)